MRFCDFVYAQMLFANTKTIFGVVFITKFTLSKKKEKLEMISNFNFVFFNNKTISQNIEWAQTTTKIKNCPNLMQRPAETQFHFLWITWSKRNLKWFTACTQYRTQPTCLQLIKTERVSCISSSVVRDNTRRKIFKPEMTHWESQSNISPFSDKLSPASTEDWNEIHEIRPCCMLWIKMPP